MPSKDQQSIDEPSAYEKWDRARTLMLESLHKPDNQLRSCAHNQKCYYELLEIRDQVLEMVQNMSNPRPFIDHAYFTLCVREWEDKDKMHGVGQCNVLIYRNYWDKVERI